MCYAQLLFWNHKGIISLLVILDNPWSYESLEAEALHKSFEPLIIQHVRVKSERQEQGQQQTENTGRAIFKGTSR